MIINRSRLVLSVPKHPELTEEFPFNQVGAAKEALERRRREHPGKKVRLTQNEDCILVRIRKRGYPEINQSFPSYAAAENFELQVMAERRQGVFVDYSKSLHTTVADLIVKFMAKELPKMKGGANYSYFFQAMLDDSKGLLEKDLAEREREIAETGRSEIKIKAARSPMGSLEWIHKPLTEVTAEDIEDWMESRQGDVAPATIWREYEHVRGMINLAIKTWGYPMRINPTTGVRRVNFQNERTRRLVDDEFDRIMAAARRFDAAKSLEARVQELIRECLQEKTFKSESHRKRLMVVARAEVSEAAAKSSVHRPVMECFILFQLATAARRGESLGMLWSQVDLEQKTAFLPETKNSYPRTLALRDDLVELLRELPQAEGRVFALGVKACRNAWKEILTNAGVPTDGEKKLTIHDLRHEAISSVAEAGLSFSLVELQAFSGHRDTRMLLRYLHLSMSGLANKLSAALESGQIKNGRKRLDPKLLSMSDLVAESAAIPTVPLAAMGAPPLRPVADNVIRFPGKYFRSA